jgi:hypothetical protein
MGRLTLKKSVERNSLSLCVCVCVNRDEFLLHYTEISLFIIVKYFSVGDEQYFFYIGGHYTEVLLYLHVDLFKIHNYIILLSVQVPCIQFQCYTRKKFVKLIHIAAILYG